MSKFYFGMVGDLRRSIFLGDLRRSIFLVASSQVKIPVFVTMNVDFTMLDTGKTRSIAINKYSRDWQDKIVSFLKNSLSNDEFDKFEFNFITNDAYRESHSISYTINTKLAESRIIEMNDKKREENRIKHSQEAMKELQDAYLSQDVNNNDFEEGSRLPSIED